MEKLLHERLREYDEQSCSFICDNGRSVTGLWNSEANSLADEIEKYYDPKLRFEDGEPAKEGDKHVDQYGHECTISSIDKRARIWDENGGYDVVEVCKPLKRTEPKVLDADGIEIKVGDTVFGNNSPIPLKVVTVYGDGDISAVGDRGICSKLDSSNYSHREPDSLEKLRNDMREFVDTEYKIPGGTKTNEWLDRLTAIMERDA